MKFIADVHVHSHYSRATSKDLDLEHLAKWAQLKGIKVVGTGDFVHPGWMAELKEKLEPAEEEGLFKLKPEYLLTTQPEVPAACKAEVRFMLSVEISNIYKRHNKVRKVHNLIFAPHFEAAEIIQAKLDTIGNIRSDGRPILGLDSHDLLEITLETDPLAYFIPAHIWTPWFSALGSKGGFDSIEAFLGDLIPHVFAAETGLSSDPPMNWRLSQLDPYILVSNSDAHSPGKLGREATVYETELSYRGIYNALAKPENHGVIGTVEFFPQEGKYHYDGHRNCKMRLHPSETREHGGLCPVCKKPVTVGVLARVEELADRPEKTQIKPPRWKPYFSLIPLPEVIADAKNVGSNTKTVHAIFQNMLAKIGNEMFILQEAPLEDIAKVTGSLIAEGIHRMRKGEVHIASGYDGEYGIIKIFKPEEREKLQRQTSFLTDTTAQEKPSSKTQMQRQGSAEKNRAFTPNQKESHSMRFYPGTQFYGHALQTIPAVNLVSDEQVFYKPNQPVTIPDLQIGNKLPDDLNAAQWRAVTYTGGHLLIVAGPGTGKTHTLTYRIAHIVQCFAPVESILAITFTNKAAEEMQQRLQLRLSEDAAGLTIGTFHSFCLHFLRSHIGHTGLPRDFNLATEQDVENTLKIQWPEKSAFERKHVRELISTWKAKADFENAPDEVLKFNRRLREIGLLDFDDLILETLALLQQNEKIAQQMRSTFQYVFVDEYQDINAAQHALLKKLVGENTMMTAIGDPNQAIYGFRGSDARFFDFFSKDFSGAKVMHLFDNYRSAKNILSASGQVIAKEASLDLPGLTAKIAASGQLTIHETATEDSEAEYVVHRIERLVGGTSLFSQDSGRVSSEAESEVSFGDVAVLYRLNSQRTALEEAFERSGIPYQVSGDKPLIAQPGVAHILSVLQLAGNVPISAKKAASLLRFLVAGIGEQTAASIQDFFQKDKKQITLEDLQDLRRQENLLSEQAKVNLLCFSEDVLDLHTRLRDSGLMATLQHMFLLDGWQEKLSQNDRLANAWQRLTRIARLCSGLPEFIDELLLQRATDALDARAERVSLMTLHAAKGLEFPVVFIVGCEKNLIPLQLERYVSDPAEERRLFYVGMTRAKEQLYLLRAKKRTLFGKTLEAIASSFLTDIEEALKVYDLVAARKVKRSKKKMENQLDLFG